MKILDLTKSTDYSQDDIVDALGDGLEKKVPLRIIFEMKSDNIDLSDLQIEIDAADGESFDDEGLAWMFQANFSINGDYYDGFSFSKVGEPVADFVVEKIEKASRISDEKYRFELLVKYYFTDVDIMNYNMDDYFDE